MPRGRRLGGSDFLIGDRDDLHALAIPGSVGPAKTPSAGIRACTVSCTLPLQNMQNSAQCANRNALKPRDLRFDEEPPEPKVTGSSPVGDT